MNDSLQMRLGAVVLALLTLAAVVFAVLNFQQRSRYILPDDGVTWMETSQGVMAWPLVFVNFLVSHPFRKNKRKGWGTGHYRNNENAIAQF